MALGVLYISRRRIIVLRSFDQLLRRRALERETDQANHGAEDLASRDFRDAFAAIAEMDGNFPDFKPSANHAHSTDKKEGITFVRDAFHQFGWDATNPRSPQ